MFKLIATILLLLVSVQINKSSYLREVKSPEDKLPPIYASEKTVPYSDFSDSIPTPTIFPKEIISESPKSDTSQISAYNVNSENYVGELPSHAVENSGALIPCDANTNCNITNSPTPSSILTNTPTPTIIIPSITEIPLPTFTPDPRRCLEVVCPMIACLDSNLDRQNPEIIYEDCRCPCYPPAYDIQ